LLAFARPEAAAVERKEARTTARRTSAHAALAVVLVAAALLTARASADTKSELDAAERELDSAQAQLSAATARWQAAQSELEGLQDRIAATRARIAERASAIRSIQRGVQRRAILAFQSGPASTIDMLLSSASITELSDRLEFLDSVARGDSDLMTALQVEQQRLEWDRQALASDIDEQAALTAEYQDAKNEIAVQTGRLRNIYEGLERQYRQEQRSLTVLGQSVNASGFIERCPVAGPNSFVDSFGWPRSGGRTHEGIDLIAAPGTPVVASHAGVVSQSSSYLGGIQAYVRAPSGSYTFYAHLSGFATSAGVSVSAGTQIGYVGSTGNAGVPHLHFEYHPGGGGAVNPYPDLLLVC
jgi:murein DD-endopeptidase MepM/ murein hydrolase activator NlpD